jgi:phosphinothricin acetyltransferase
MVQETKSNPKQLTIRFANEGDLPAITTIYNHFVRTTTASFDTVEQSQSDRKKWLEEHHKANLPVLIAEENGVVVGWQSLSYYHNRCAYKNSVESSTYVAPSHLQRGIGKQLLNAAIAEGSKRGYHCIVGLICSENVQSLALVKRCGFEEVGTLREVGQKFDRWLDVTIVQKML